MQTAVQQRLRLGLIDIDTHRQKIITLFTRVRLLNAEYVCVNKKKRKREKPAFFFFLYFMDDNFCACQQLNIASPLVLFTR